MGKISKTLSSISINLICISLGVWVSAQDPQTPVKRAQSIAIGLDVAPFIQKGVNHDRTGLILSGRYGLKDKVFAVAEIGYENINFSKIKNQGETERLLYTFDYQSNGSFLKAGIDYNIFKVDEPGNHDNVLLGVRYGFAYQEHQSESFTVGNGYWPDYTGTTTSHPVTSHWMEAIFGLRTEVFRNFYMGWAIRGKVLLYSNNPINMEPYAVPGLGKVIKGLGFGFSYTFEYQIPFGKKQIVPASLKK